VPGLCGGPDAPGSETRGSGGGATNNAAPSSSSPPLRLSFNTAGARSAAQPWNAVLKDSVLYVAPPDYLADGSKEAFVALLEAAEEKLKCEYVVVVFEADRQDKATLVRTFMFLGFTVLNPGSPLVPPKLASRNICMCYNVNE